MIIAEVSIFPLGTETPSVSQYVRVAIRELEASGLKCTPGPMGTTVTVEAETAEEAYVAIARAQAAVFELGAGRAYTVIKMDERRDVGRPLRGGYDGLGPLPERSLTGGQRSHPAAPHASETDTAPTPSLRYSSPLELTDRTSAGTTMLVQPEVQRWRR